MYFSILRFNYQNENSNLLFLILNFILKVKNNHELIYLSYKLKGFKKWINKVIP